MEAIRTAERTGGWKLYKDWYYRQTRKLILRQRLTTDDDFMKAFEERRLWGDLKKRRDGQ